MPTPNAAASRQPTTNNEPLARQRPARFGRLAAIALVLPVATAVAVAQPAPVAANAGPSCSSWTSLTRPPDSVRVLRVQSGRIETVNFRKYVVTVMGKEWPSYLPLPVVEAGAVAVKQYAWYHAVYSSRTFNGRCFDVKDSTGDQLYKPSKSRIRPDHYKALDATWNVSLRKPGGRFFMTGYRRGEKVRCGRDATGYKLFARSATQCAYNGNDWRQILRTYYGPGLDIVGGGGTDNATTPDSQATDAAVQPTTSQPTLGESAADSAAVRLSNGRWVDESDESPAEPAAVPSGGFGGSADGGLAAELAAPTVPAVPTVPTGPFQRLVVDPFVVA